MASGRDIQLTRQIGEYRVAAELGRRGWLATTFTGSVPGFDILAIDPTGHILEVQVKTLRSGTWQLNAGQFLDISIRKGVQEVTGPRRISTRRRVFVFVQLSATGNDAFYLCTLEQLQDVLLRDYKAGRRPKNPKTLHHSLPPKALALFADNWGVLDEPPEV